MLSLLLGVISTFLVALAPVYALAHVWGWLLRWQGVAVPSGKHVISAHVTSAGWLLPSAIGAGITLLLFMIWWWTLHPYDVHEGQMSRASLAWLAWLAWLLDRIDWPAWLVRLGGSPGWPGGTGRS